MFSKMRGGTTYMIIEVIADSVNDARMAQVAGASRIELISGALEGGITPSYGLIKAVCSLNIPVNVMIRPHSRSFCYTPEELEIMINDIEVCKKSGAAGVVFGVLTEQNDIDEKVLGQLIEAAEGLDITFHRAFDEVTDQIKALRILQTYPEISRVLTSGGEEAAITATTRLQQLIKESEDSHLKIMAGSGLTADNIAQLLAQASVNEIHIGSGARFNASFSHSIDPAKIAAIIKIAGSVS